MRVRKYVTFSLMILISLLMASALLRSVPEFAPSPVPIEDLLARNSGNGTEPTGSSPAPNGEPELSVTGAAHIHYLRTAVYSIYVNGKWREGNATRIPSGIIARPEITVPHHEETDTVTVVSSVPLKTLPTALHTVRVEAPGVSALPEYDLFQTATNVTFYRFRAITYTFDPPYLLNLTAGNLTDYLNAPNDRDLATLAMRITLGAKSDYEKAERIMYYLTGNYALNESAAPPNNTDRLRWFLFHSKTGSSYDFATAFVLLARLNGLPSRLVEGFGINATPEPQRITGKNRLYWAEVYFRGAGWLTFDPINDYTNVFRPFEIKLEENEFTVPINGSVLLRVHFLDVASGLNATLRITDWTGRELFTTTRPGTFEIPVGPFKRPGSYALFVNASARDGSTVVLPVRVNVIGRAAVYPEGDWIIMRYGETTRALIRVRGLESVAVSSDSPLVAGTLYLSSDPKDTGVLVVFLTGNRTPPGWQRVVLELRGKEENQTVVLPVLIVDPPEVDPVLPVRLMGGTGFEISGTVRGRESGHPLESGLVYATIESDRLHLLGVGKVSGGRFSFNATVPTELPGGRFILGVTYLPPAGVPGDGSSSGQVIVIGLTEITVPEEVIAPPGNVTVTGILRGRDGHGIANATIGFLLDGAPAGELRTSPGGTFRVTVPVAGVEVHRLGFLFNGTDFYAGSSALTVVRTVKLKLPKEINVTLGSPLNLRGALVGVENATLKAYIFPDREYRVRVENGSFSVVIEPFPTVGERTLEFRSGAHILGRIVLRVVSPVEIRLLGTEREDDSATLRLGVFNRLGEPVPGMRLVVRTENLTEVSTTNSSGIAIARIPVGEDAEVLNVTVIFEGSGYYLPARASFRVPLHGEGGPWGIAAVIGLLLAVYVATRRKNPGVGNSPTVAFPDGVPVYREGERIEVTAGCDGAELLVDGHSLGVGRKFTLVLPAGEHWVEVRCRGKSERVRVVVVRDYADAVGMFYERCLLPWAGNLGLDVEKMTPREIAGALAEKLYPPKPLDIITGTFERARYGTGGLSRGDFIRFYRALLELVGGECVV